MAELPVGFYTDPENTSANLDTRELREILAATGGIVQAQGSLWKLCSESVSAGVRRVWLEKKEPSTVQTRHLKEPCEICARIHALADDVNHQVAGAIPQGAEGRDVAMGRLERALGALHTIEKWSRYMRQED